MDPLNSTTLDLSLCSVSASPPSNLALKLSCALRPMQAVLANIYALPPAWTGFLPVLSAIVILSFKKYEYKSLAE